jgi:hypothetical protein
MRKLRLKFQKETLFPLDAETTEAVVGGTFTADSCRGCGQTDACSQGCTGPAPTRREQNSCLCE